MDGSHMRRIMVALALSAGALSACSEDSQLFELTVGDCMNSTDLTSEQILDVEILACSDAHDIEVFAATQLEGTEFPGRDAVSALAESYCYSQFEAFVGIPYESSQLTVNWMYPTSETWTDLGDREVLCLLTAPQPVTGSLQGTGR